MGITTLHDKATPEPSNAASPTKLQPSASYQSLRLDEIESENYTLATTRNKLKIHLRRVDGKDTEGAKSVAVLPGPHEFTINLEWYFARISLPRAKVRFRTKAGHKYAIKAFCVSPAPGLRADVSYWVTDETEGRVVWGNKPDIIGNPMRDTRSH